MERIETEVIETDHPVWPEIVEARDDINWRAAQILIERRYVPDMTITPHLCIREALRERYGDTLDLGRSAQRAMLPWRTVVQKWALGMELNDEDIDRLNV